MIKHCDHCRPHRFQDARYGPGRRVMNAGNKGARCTVCSHLYEGAGTTDRSKGEA